MKLSRKALAGIAAAVIIIAAGGITAGITLTGSPPVTSRGSIEVDTDVASGTEDPCASGQAVILAPDSSVIGSVQLQPGKTAESAVLGQEEISTVYTWKMTVPSESRYGIQACGASHGTQWETPAQVKAGVSLDLDLTGD